MPLRSIYIAAFRVVFFFVAIKDCHHHLVVTGQVLPPEPPLARVLLWLPVHASEPDEFVHGAVNCLFRRWAPTLNGRAFDVVVTLAAGDGDMAAGLAARAATLQAIVADGVQHPSNPPPTITALPIALSTDAYDVDEAQGRRSSFAGPNELFYGGMIQEEGTTISTLSSAASSLSTLIARYDFVQVVETDCCATADGWLDALLQPMLHDPALLISGSRGRGACWTGTEFGGCTRMVDAATPHAHLRDHINGNAMYRVGQELTQLVKAARTLYNASVPFDVALHLAGGGADGRAFDNRQAYSAMGLPVDEARFTRSDYYGTATGDAVATIAFVHAARRLRAPALQAVLRRLDPARPVTVIVIPPGRVDPAMLARMHASLTHTKETRNAVYLVSDEEAYAVVARMAPMRVLMAGQSGQAGEPAPAPFFTSLASMARAGLATFTIGLDATIAQPYTRHLMGLADGQAGKAVAWVADGETLVASRIPKLLFLPPGEQAGLFLEAWGSGGDAAALASQIHLSPLPPDLFPLASSYAGPLWTGAARTHVAAVVAWDGQMSPATPASLSAVGLWRTAATPVPPPFRCANYSVLGTHPLPLTNVPTIHRSLSVRAVFSKFMSEHAIACAVLPGFKLATTGNVVPDGVVLGASASFGGAVITFTSLADLKSSSGGVGGEYVPFEYQGLAPTSKRAHRPAACAVFGLAARKSCFSPAITARIGAAIMALPPRYQCLVDPYRTHRDVALLSLEDRLGDVGEVVRRGAGRRGGQRLPVLLTGAWRQVNGGRLSSKTLTATPKITTLADLTAPLRQFPVDPVSRLVQFGPAIDRTSSFASSPWADVIEYALCERAAGGVRELGDESMGVLPSTASTILARLAALIPPAVLAEDLHALARWLARPDRPSSLVSAKRARLKMTDSAVGGDDFQDAVLAPSLGLARAVGAKVVTLPSLPVPWSAIIGEAALQRAYTDNPSLLPASIGVLLGPTVDAKVTASTTTTKIHPASAHVLHSPAHRAAVRALERARSMAHKLALPPALYLPAAARPAQTARLKHFAAGVQDLVFSFGW